jgi:ketosteroid isomerase-like protein
MRWRGSGVVLAMAALALAVACGTSVEEERVNLLARDREFSTAVKDMDRLLSFYVPEASLYLPEMPLATGIANIRSAAMKFAEDPGFSIEWEPTGVGLSGSGDFGYTVGTYRMTTQAAGRPSTINGTYVEVWKKARGEWKVVEHILHPDTK